MNNRYMISALSSLCSLLRIEESGTTLIKEVSDDICDLFKQCQFAFYENIGDTFSVNIRRSRLIADLRICLQLLADKEEISTNLFKKISDLFKSCEIDYVDNPVRYIAPISLLTSVHKLLRKEENGFALTQDATDEVIKLFKKHQFAYYLNVGKWDDVAVRRVVLLKSLRNCINNHYYNKKISESLFLRINDIFGDITDITDITDVIDT